MVLILKLSGIYFGQKRPLMMDENTICKSMDKTRKVRRIFSSEFKVKVALEIIKVEDTWAQISKKCEQHSLISY